MINVAVLGYGTVGSGVVEVIEQNKALVNKKSAEELNVKYILDLRDFPGDPYENKVVHDVNVILNDDEVSIVCEVMGGVGAAYQFTKQALEKGKSVCTSNKELVAKHGPELLELAKANNCNYLFEASVGGGIPIIRPINDCLTAEKIESITGILNGTTNYILSKMEKEGADFADVLKEAQDKGYAERNPEADVEGHDACRKIAILSSLMMGKNVDSEKVFTEGITKITVDDYIYTVTQFLDPGMHNYRASNFYNGNGALANAAAYFEGEEGVTFDQVGIIKNDDYTMTFVYANPVSLFNFYNNHGSMYLLNEKMYEANKTDADGLVKSSYNTAADKAASCGPYIVTEYQEDKVVKRVGDLQVGEQISVRMTDGFVKAKIEEKQVDKE